MTPVPGDEIDWGTFGERWDIVRRRKPPAWARGTPKLLRGNVEWGLRLYLLVRRIDRAERAGP